MAQFGAVVDWRVGRVRNGATGEGTQLACHLLENPQPLVPVDLNSDVNRYNPTMSNTDRDPPREPRGPQELRLPQSPSPPLCPWDDTVQQVLEAALDASVTIDSAGRVIFWSTQATQTFGWTEDEALGRSLSELVIPPSLRKLHEDGLANYFRTGQGPVLGQRVELPTAMRKGGEEFPIELRVVPVQVGDETLFHGYACDISERAEDAEYRMRMAALVDSSYDGIIGKDVSGRIISWNLGAERIYGYTEEEAVGTTASLILPHGIKQEEPQIRRAMRTGQRLVQFETVRRRKDGRLINVSLTVSPITDDDGVVIGSSNIVRDITQANRQKEELQRAIEEAEEASRLRSEFLANVSHELRTPMSAIIGMTQLALEDELSDDVRDYINTANDAAHSLLTLLNDILDFSKLESGTFQIKKEPFCLRESLDETLKTLAPKAFEKGLELVCDVEPAVPEWLVGDAARLRQVLTNLIGNAIKFTDRGEVVCSVRLMKSWPSAAWLQFEVNDTGVGIPESEQERIIEPFMQVDATTTRQHGGTGLGLAICRELLDLMGGRLQIVSEPGVGSSFSFQLSFAPAKTPPNAAPAVPLGQLSEIRVLVVDDNETSRRMLTNTLANWAIGAETAKDGEEALQRIRQAAEDNSPFVLAIVDALMPSMDGFDLTQCLAESEACAPAVVLMLSSSDRREFKSRELDAHTAVCLRKPVSQSDLLDAVMQALNVRIGDALTAATEDEHSLHHPVSATLNVLVAEDVPANQKIVSSMLAKRGHQVTIAQNGREAVELCKQRGFDVILMDIQMPTMDGYQATAAIRKLEAGLENRTPIIAMTAHAMPQDRERCLAAGMDGYLAKPLDVTALVEAVERSPGSRGACGASEPGAIAEAGEPLDMDDVRDRLAGDMELFREFVQYFDEDVAEKLEQIREAVAQRNWDRLHRAAHGMKGLVANLGAKPSVAVARELELRGAERNGAGLDELLRMLESELQRLDAALASHRDEKPQGGDR
ncbi:MAG: response regulator [Planctomycetales bacterium]|nr:response regulator [Planctomycetales bacterium]